jgi:hypothetical protein
LLSLSHLFDHAVQRAAKALLRKLVACHCDDGGGFRGCGEGVQVVTTCARNGLPPRRG